MRQVNIKHNSIYFYDNNQIWINKRSFIQNSPNKLNYNLQFMSDFVLPTQSGRLAFACIDIRNELYGMCDNSHEVSSLSAPTSVARKHITSKIVNRNSPIGIYLQWVILTVTAKAMEFDVE